MWTTESIVDVCEISNARMAIARACAYLGHGMVNHTIIMCSGICVAVSGHELVKYACVFEATPDMQIKKHEI